VAVRIEDLPQQIECLVQHAEWLDARGDGPRAAAILALLLGRPEISANVRRDVEHWLHAHGWAVHGSAPAPELSHLILPGRLFPSSPLDGYSRVGFCWYRYRERNIVCSNQWTRVYIP
jgi:hypothetical protein